MKFKELILIILCLISSKVFSQDITIDSLLSKINKLESDNQFAEAKSLIKLTIINYDDNWFELSKELIYINEKLGLYEENLKVFKEAHQKGYFYFMHPAMPKYKPYKELEEFIPISQKDLQLLSDANKTSKTIHDVQLPDNYNYKLSYPVIFLLHGGGKNIQDVKTHWQVSELNQNYIKVYVQSYRHFDSETFGWSSLNEKLVIDFKDIYSELIANYKIDTTSILMGSISAGANVVIELALRQIIPIKGYIVYCPPLPQFLKNKNIDLIKNHNVKSYIVSGESDHFLPRQKLMMNLFDSLNLDYNYTIVKNMGHEYPENENLFVEQGIKYILK